MSEPLVDRLDHLPIRHPKVPFALVAVVTFVMARCVRGSSYVFASLAAPKREKAILT